ncbi:MAG: chemotaxis protein CheW [Xanthomonadales bacterium]|nr:chemotaxis protein CheW [Xanthomonadales bacterium]
MTTNTNRAAFLKLQEYARRGESFQPGSSSRRLSHEWSGVTFRLGDSRLACNIERIQEILTPPVATPVPGAKPWILGLANVRGSLMTVIDLAWFLNGTQTSVTTQSRLLSASLQKAPVGLLIDEVFGQRHFVEGEASDSELSGKSSLGDLICRKHQVGKEEWHELELDKLFNSQEFLNGAAI